MHPLTYFVRGIAEQRLLNFATPDKRVEDLDTFSKEASDTSRQHRLTTTREAHRAATHATNEVRDAYEVKKKAIEHGWMGRLGRVTSKIVGGAIGWRDPSYRAQKADERQAKEQGMMDKAMEKEVNKVAEEKAEATLKAAEARLHKYERRAALQIEMAGAKVDRKVALATARVTICEEVILDLGKEVTLLQEEEKALRDLAKTLGKKEVTLDDLKVAEGALDAAKRLKVKADNEKKDAEATVYGTEVRDAVGQISKHLFGLAAKYGDSSLYDLEDAIFDKLTKTGDPKKLDQMIDALSISKEEKQLLKDAAAKLTADRKHSAAAMALFNVKLQERLSLAKAANEATDVKARLTVLSEKAKRGQKIRVLTGAAQEQTFVLSRNNWEKEGRKYLMLLGSNGQYASIDLEEDAGSFVLTYKEGETVKEAKLTATVAPEKRKDDRIVYFSSEAADAPPPPPEEAPPSADDSATAM